MKAARGFAPAGNTPARTLPVLQPKPPALSLAQGLKLLDTTEGLIGWQVVAADGSKRNTLLGTIDKVRRYATSCCNSWALLQCKRKIIIT